MVTKPEGRISLFLMLTSGLVCLNACAYQKPKQIDAVKGITQCFTAKIPGKLQPFGTECSWQISSNHSDYVIRVTVEETDIATNLKRQPSSCLFRHVIILDGMHSEADSLGHWCGTAKQTYTTSGPHAFVYFRSDAMVKAATYQVCHKALKIADEVGEEEKGISAYGMFGYIVLGWVVLLVALKLTWDRVKKIHNAFHHEEERTETNYREMTEPRIDLSIISVAPPPYDNGPVFPNEAPPPYVPRRHSHSDAVAGSYQRIVLDNFILTRAPPPAYSSSEHQEVFRNTRPENSTDSDGRGQNDTNTTVGVTNEGR